MCRFHVILTCEQLSWAETIPSLIRESDCCLHLNAGTRGRNPAEEKLNAKPSDCRDTLAAVRGLTRATAAISYHTSRAVNKIISGNFHNIWYSENSPSQLNQGEVLLASRGCLPCNRRLCIITDALRDFTEFWCPQSWSLTRPDGEQKYKATCQWHSLP